MAQILLQTAADAQNINLPTASTTSKVITDFDFPEGARPILPYIKADQYGDNGYPAFEVTCVRVTHQWYSDDDASEYVDLVATVYGYPLTKAMARSKSANHNSLDAWREVRCPITWELKRAAKTAALLGEGHDLTSAVEKAGISWDAEQQRKADWRAEQARQIVEAKAAKEALATNS